MNLFRAELSLQQSKSKPLVTTKHRSFSSVIPLPDEDAGLTNSIVRLNNIHIGNPDGRISRRTPLVIINNESRQWTLRYAMGNGGTVKGLNKDVLALDYDAICDLGIRYKRDVSLTVRKATLIESTRWLVCSPDLNVRLNTRFALLGVALGLVSLVITFVTLL